MQTKYSSAVFEVPSNANLTNVCTFSRLERATEDTAELSGDDECPKRDCEFCSYGYVKDSQGCATCECIKGKNIKLL